MSFSFLAKRWFGKRQGARRNSRHGPVQTRNKIAARESGKLMLEMLEDRLAPAGVSLAGPVLSFTAGSVAETIAVTAPSPNTLNIAITTNIPGQTDTISLGSGTDSNFVVTNNSSMTSSSLQISNVNTSSGDSIKTFDVFLPNSSSVSDTLNFSLANNPGIVSVFIGGPQNGQNGPPTTDSADAVMLNSLSISGFLNVSAETINFQQGAPVDALSTVLTSVNSLTFASTGVPYLGAVTPNAAPPAGQPFAGDTYLTGPDWGTYGYAPGDQITISGATGVVPTQDYSVAGIVGHNLYLTPALLPAALPPNQLNDTAVTVACAGFTPEITASVLSLNVTGTGSSISGAIDGVILQGSTQNGNITLQDVDTTLPLAVGPLNAGTGTIQLDVNGAINGLEPGTTFPISGFVPVTASTVDLTASALDLATTGSGGSIGASFPLITAIDGELTATTNDGGVNIVDQGPGLTINSIVADQGGQAPVVSNGQVVYNTNSTPPYASGDENVSISSTGPIVLNSVSATGDVTITSSAYILEGNAQSPNIIAQEVDLIAQGTAEYQGSVIFANNPGGDTLTLPTGDWSSYGFPNGNYPNGMPIFVSGGALASANEGAFTVASVLNNVLTLTPGESYVLAPETEPGVSVGDGMIGQVNAPIALSDVPLFSATTANGGIYLQPGGGVNSTAVDVDAGGMNGMTNNVAVTSEANFLTVENITATGNAAVAMNSGSLFEPSANYGAIVSISAPTNDGSATGGDYRITSLFPFSTITWAEEGFAPGDLISVNLDPFVNPATAYTIASISTDGDTLYLSPGETIAGGVSFVAVHAYGEVTGQNVSLTSPYNMGTASSPFLTNATSGLTVATTATSPSSAAIYVDNLSPLTSIGVSTYDGNATIYSDYNGSNYADGLSFDNNVLSETGNAVVTFMNTDNNNGSAGDVIISGPVYVSAISAGISATGAVGTGQILSAANSNATIDGNGGGLILSAGSGIGTPGAFVDVNLTTLDATTTTGGIYIQNTSNFPMTLSASASNGNIDVNSLGTIELSNKNSGTADSVSTTGTVTLDATNGSIFDENGSTVNASVLILTATYYIGSASSPLETSSPSTLTLTAAAENGGLFLDSNAPLTVNSATAGGDDLSLSATGNLTLLGDVYSSLYNVSLTATNGTLTTNGSVLISGDALALNAEQIGAPNDVIQTSASTITAAANYGGIYLSNDNYGVLTLGAAAVGPTLSSGPTNNIVIYSAGNIVLLPQTTNLTQLATPLPVAVLNPGGSLTLMPGDYLSADGTYAPAPNPYATITSADAGQNPSTYYDVWTGTYDIAGASQFTDNFSTTNSGPLDIVDNAWSVPSGSFTVDNASQTATATSSFNLAVAFGIDSVNESAQATISGTLASGQTAGLVALYSSSSTYYYGAIFANSSSTYIAYLYDAATGFSVEQSYTGTVSNAVLEFSVTSSSSFTLLLNGTVVASVTDASITTTAGYVGMVASYGVSFTNFSSGPSLQIENNTSEVLVLAPGSVSSTNTLLQLTASQLEAGGTYSAGTIEILDLGVNGQPGTVNVPGDLVLVATAGPITFQNTLDTIDATGTGTITVVANDVADLGNLTTAGGNITISAGGNIGVGTVNAGSGTVSITSSSGAIFNSTTGSTTLSITAGLLALHSSNQSSSSGQSASAAASAAQSASIQAQLNAAEAAATAEAAAAVAAADQSTAAAFKAALTSMQAAVAIANLTYQSDKQTTTAYNNNVVTPEQKVVTGESIALDVLNGINAAAQIVSSSFSVAAAIADDIAYTDVFIPIIGEVSLVAAGQLSLASAFAGLLEGIDSAAVFAASSALTADTITLGNDQTQLAMYQSAQDSALAQLNADMDTATAFAAAYNVAEQNYNSALAIANQDEQASQAAAAAAAVAEANAAAASQAASVAGQLVPPTLNVTGPVQISNATGAAGINWTNPIVSNNTVTEQSQGPLTISGVTIQSGSSVALAAASNVNIASGSTIEAASTSPITITANTNNAASGATVTVDGTLSAQSASIGVGPNATGNETFTITPSATTPISVNGGSDSSGANTLNYNADGLNPSLSEAIVNNQLTYTITAAGVQPVTFTNIEIINITNEAGGGSLTLMGMSGQDNAMSLVGTGQGAGIATLNHVPILFSGMTSFDYQGGGATAGDTITVTPFVTSHWNLAVTVAGSSAVPASLTYNSVDSLADTLTVATTGEYSSIGSPGLATVQFQNVNEVTTNAAQSRGAELSVNLPDGSSQDTASLSLVGNGTADINFGLSAADLNLLLFGLNVDTADYAGLTINGNTVGTNNMDLVTSTGAGLSLPLTLNYADTHCVVNTGAATSVQATASGDLIGVNVPNGGAAAPGAGLVEVNDLFGNFSEFAVTDTQLVLSDLGNNDTININDTVNVAGNNPYTNGIYVDGNASFSDVLNYTAGSDAAVTVTPGKATVSQAGADAVFYAGIQSLNLAASGSTSTLTVNGSATAETFDFTQTGAGAGSFTVAGPGAAIATSPLFTYTGFGNGVGVEGGTSLDQPGLSVGTRTGSLATVTGYSCVNASVSATISLTSGQYAGLVARYTGTSPHQNLDLGFVVAGSNSYTAYIYRDVNGALTRLFKQTYRGSVAANSTLTFDAVGSSLILSLNGNIIGSATDKVLAAIAGSVGTWASSGAVLSNFGAAPVTLQTASNPFSDNFTTSSAGGSLSTYWINQTGAFQVNTSSGTATATAPVNLATVNGINNANEAVSATINTLTTGQKVGLVARYGGSGLANMYYGEIVAGSGKFTAHIYRYVNGVSTSLVSKTYMGTATGMTLEFDVVGTFLQLYLNNKIVAHANDSTFTTGSVGMMTSGGAVIVSNFNAVAITTPTAGYPFSTITVSTKDGDESSTATDTVVDPPSTETANQLFVSQLYQDLLGRTVDNSGLAAWSGLLDSGVARSQVVLDIESSAEYRTDEVEGIYQNLLQRQADAQGLATFTAFLTGGGTVEQVQALIAGSPEYWQTRAGGTNAGFLDALYQDGLGRSPDATGLGTFTNALNAGASRAQIASAIFSSPEYYQDLVRGMYQEYLGRLPDASGQNAFTSALAHGIRDEVVIAALLGSDEYFNALL